MPNGFVVLAIGGNSLIRDAAHLRVNEQFDVTRETCRHVADVLAAGWNVVLTHGNGPQVGFILRRSELSLHELHPVPLDSVDADTQGAIGYMIQQQLGNEFRRRGQDRRVVTVVTQVRVEADDPAFARPTKPIGAWMDEATARRREAQEGWTVREDAGRGWRCVVASPEPREIVELDAIRDLVAREYVVVAVGGGGIPVVRDPESGDLRGVAAVIDKDLASALLARALDADVFLISTAVPRVCLDWGKPTQREVAVLTVAEARRHLAEGQFPAGSMGPKIEAAVRFVESGGRAALITAPDQLVAALEGRAGTRIVA